MSRTHSVQCQRDTPVCKINCRTGRGESSEGQICFISFQMMSCSIHEYGQSAFWNRGKHLECLAFISDLGMRFLLIRLTRHLKVKLSEPLESTDWNDS